MNTNPLPRTSFGATGVLENVVADFFRRVYLWMTLGLATTGVIAFFVASSPALIQAIFTTPLRWVVFLAPLGIVLAMSFLQEKLSPSLAMGLFFLYAALNGVAFSSIFLVYTGTSISVVFFITGGMFASISAFGFITKRDLSAMGRFFFMGLIGLLIAMVVNMFLQSPALTWAISVIGVIVFAGLTAWDTQKLKNMVSSGMVVSGTEAAQKLAIFGALMLYLDFINMFLFLLRLVGNRR